jgi:hypothetical protein
VDIWLRLLHWNGTTVHAEEPETTDGDGEFEFNFIPSSTWPTSTGFAAVFCGSEEVESNQITVQ